MASSIVVVRNNIDTINDNKLFVENGSVEITIQSSSCKTNAPMYVYYLSHKYIGDDTANILLWISVGLNLLFIAALGLMHYKKHVL